MLNEGLGSWPARRARMTPHHIAIKHDGATVSYSQLGDRVNRAAHALENLGVRPGDRVAYLGPNHPAFLETLFATGAVGAIFVAAEHPAGAGRAVLHAGRFRGPGAGVGAGAGRFGRRARRAADCPALGSPWTAAAPGRPATRSC